MSWAMMMDCGLLFADMAARAAAKTEMSYHGADHSSSDRCCISSAVGGLVFLASRRMALTPLMVLICFIPSAQRIVIFGADFTLLRIMVLFG